MNRIPLSPAASGLLRALIARTSVPRDRILLIDAQSIDWQSLTFVGERHRFDLRVRGPDSSLVVERLSNGLEEAEFSVPGQIVAGISVVSMEVCESDQSTSVRIEALTVCE